MDATFGMGLRDRAGRLEFDDAVPVQTELGH